MANSPFPKWRGQRGPLLLKVSVIIIILMSAINMSSHRLVIENSENSDVFSIKFFLTAPSNEKKSSASLSRKPSSEKNKLWSLQCEKYGGPGDEISSEMVYWRDISSDAAYRTAFQKFHSDNGEEKFMLFEPDIGGWNNIRCVLYLVPCRNCIHL